MVYVVQETEDLDLLTPVPLGFWHFPQAGTAEVRQAAQLMRFWLLLQKEWGKGLMEHF